MQEVMAEVFSNIVSLAVGGLIGYVVAYVTGLRAIRKGMQLIIRATLNDMNIRFQQQPPTADDKQIFEEIYKCYEHLGENGVMAVKRDAVLAMAEAVRK